MSNDARSMALMVPATGSIESYVHSVNSIPMLSAEREHELAERLHQDGDLQAARELIMSHLRFVVHVAKSYSGYGLPQADLIQEGNVGLMKAVKRFDPTVGVRLVSFAVHWIKAEIHEYVIKNWRIVKIATTKAQRKLFFNLRSKKKRLGWFSADEVNMVAEELGVSPSDVREMEGRLSSPDQAFDVGVDDDEEGGFAPVHYLEDKSSDVADTVAEDQWQQQTSQRLGHAIAALDERSQDILRSRWLSEDKLTLHDLADKYQVSAERIRQLEKNALKKLKSSMDS